MTSKQSTKEKRPIRFWLQIGLILLCGVAASVVAWTITNKQIAEEREAAKPRYTVTFAEQNGNVIDTRQVKEGAGTFPPTYETDAIFRGWSAGFNQVQSDIEVHPMLYAITNEENLFYFDSVYVQEGEQFHLDLRLGGNVCISNAELSLEYDDEVMEFVEASDTAISTITKTEDGKLLVKLDSSEQLKDPLLLSTLTFTAKQKDVYSTEVSLNCIQGFLANGSKEVPATVTTLNNNVYYLQEVSQ